ncbi:hypothetical protein DPX39_010047900 [Trypanosoma brucei equiperdum]|uniref:Uncharacterized protein n=1 Tax=Trypanosoma brucei equiperdum TaxID=630700 RepID=A0A3L6LC77_9TRYP|nr:hypothetical protein DPX39_010047900 [Trypanosoma brucei equiperdum]
MDEPNRRWQCLQPLRNGLKGTTKLCCIGGVLLPVSSIDRKFPRLLKGSVLRY